MEASVETQKYSDTNSLYGMGYRNTQGGDCLIFQWNKWRYGAPSLCQGYKALFYVGLDFYGDGLRFAAVIRQTNVMLNFVGLLSNSHSSLELRVSYIWSAWEADTRSMEKIARKWQLSQAANQSMN